MAEYSKIIIQSITTIVQSAATKKYGWLIVSKSWLRVRGGCWFGFAGRANAGCLDVDKRGRQTAWLLAANGVAFVGRVNRDESPSPFRC